jgi:hypothetical protein
VSLAGFCAPQSTPAHHSLYLPRSSYSANYSCWFPRRLHSKGLGQFRWQVVLDRPRSMVRSRIYTNSMVRIFHDSLSSLFIFSSDLPPSIYSPSASGPAWLDTYVTSTSSAPHLCYYHVPFHYNSRRRHLCREHVLALICEQFWQQSQNYLSFSFSSPPTLQGLLASEAPYCCVVS